MAGRPDDVDQTWRARTMPLHTEVATRPLDATIVGAPEPAPSYPLPPISVGEPAGEGEPAAPGQVGPDLVVVGILGEGGMGRVELARQRSLEREVAIKRLRAGGTDWDAQLLRAEALVTGHLEHPNIIPIHALGLDSSGQPVIVMKRVEGVCWRDLLHDPNHPGWARREPDPGARLVWHLAILAQLCNAIAFAHSRGIVHRDVKPDNVMVGEFGEVYLLDWGVAVRTGAASRDAAGHPIIVGTPAYMAPEMARGGILDEATDVYLLGATLHEILTGQVRHGGNDILAVTEQALASRPFDYASSVAGELAQLANQATSVDPTARPPGALAFRQALFDHLSHRSSLRLSAGADRVLAAVEAGKPTAAAHGRAIEESRFGYREALREWPDNPDALRGLRRCAVATVRLEIARRDASAARTALAELGEQPPELRDALARLESALADEQAEQGRLRLLAHDADPTVGAPARVLMLSMFVVVTASLIVYAARLDRTGSVGPSQLVLFPALLAAGSILFLFRYRRQLAVNAFNRRLSRWLTTLLLLLLANRVAGQSTGASVPNQFVSDGILLAAMFAAGGIFIFRWLWACSAVMLASVAVAIAVPHAAHLAFEAAAAVSIVIAGVLIPRRRVDGRPP